MVKALRESLAGCRAKSVAGILNGTCNFILTEMEFGGRPFADVLAEAQRLGYAEADPTMDIGGFDAGHKLAILSAIAFGALPDLEHVRIEGIETVTLTDARWREMVDVNLRFNKAIKPVTDHDQFGVVERWTYADTGSGDCEDYVLEKRRELASRGWPLAALLITVVIDKDGGGHAVLSVMTDKGEFILDNQTDAILPWSQSELIFIKRQSPANPNTWVDLGRAFGRPDAITASVSRSQTQRVR
ncbi:MAG: transglutaminase [Nitrospiraceae bacterium]|nr:transglutaminase [Nitrospiraceae bacterium]